MSKQCTGANCSTCDEWNKEYIAPNPDFHYCTHLNMFTRNTFYCSGHYNDDDFNTEDEEMVNEENNISDVTVRNGICPYCGMNISYHISVNECYWCHKPIKWKEG